MNDNTNHGSKPFPSFSQLLLTLPSSNPEYIPTKAFRSHTEKGHILDADVISLHLSDDIKRVSWLESFLAPYLGDLADARERIAYQKCLLSPIRRVPVEILQSIFLACLPEGFVEADPYDAPLLLCQICKYWRDVALTLPLLWASFKVLRFSTGTCSPDFPLAELWLERSKSMPLSICLPVDTNRGCNPRPDDVQSFINLFFQHLSRWKSVNMCLRDLLYYEHIKEEVSAGHSTVLENLELCFPPDSVDPQVHDLGFRSLGDMVPMIWTSSPQLHTLTLNATTSQNILQILKTCPNIRDCELHINDNHVFVVPDEKLTLPHLHTLNIRGRISILNIMNAITAPSLRILTIKGEKHWSQACFQDFIDRSSCSIEEFSMVNVGIGPEYLLPTLEYIGTAVNVLRMHFYPDRRTTVKPISDAILRGIASYLLVPNLEVLDMGCDGMEPESHHLFVEMVTARLGWKSSSQSGSGTEPLHSGSSSPSHLGAGHPLRRIGFSADRDTAHLHTETLTWIESIGRQGVDVKDESAWRDYRIDGWFNGIRVWPGSHWWCVFSFFGFGWVLIIFFGIVDVGGFRHFTQG
jgi:hypothetical protein